MTDEDRSLVLKRQKLALIQKPKPKIKATGLQKYRMHNSLVKRRSATYSNMHWLLDTSGSMSGDKIWQLIDTVEYLLPKYPNVKLYEFKGGSVNAITEDRVAHLWADGGTPMFKAIQLAWRNGADAIVLVSDGDPTDKPKGFILEEVQAHSDTPIHTIGIGEHFDAEFLQALADATGGNMAECGTEDLAMLTDKFEEVLQIEDKNGKTKAGSGPIQL